MGLARAANVFIFFIQILLLISNIIIVVYRGKEISLASDNFIYKTQ